MGGREEEGNRAKRSIAGIYLLQIMGIDALLP